MAQRALVKVISGGQTGVDQGALAAANKLGIPFSGWAPLGFRCETGRIPLVYSQKMNEGETTSYPLRTRRNVLCGDITLIYCHNPKESPGTLLTMKMCKEENKPWIDMIGETSMFVENEDGYEHMARLLEGYAIINVAGSRESKFPGIFESSKARLLEVFKRLI